MNDNNDTTSTESDYAYWAAAFCSEKGRALIGTVLRVAEELLESLDDDLKPVSDRADTRLLGRTVFREGYWRVGEAALQTDPEKEQAGQALANSLRGHFVIGQALRISHEFYVSKLGYSYEQNPYLRDVASFGENCFDIGYQNAGHLVLATTTDESVEH